jgi:hypothetical protein
MNTYTTSRAVRQSLEDLSAGVQPSSPASTAQVVVVKDDSFNSSVPIQVGAIAPTSFSSIDPNMIKPQGLETVRFNFTNGTADDLNIYFGTRLGIAGGWAKTFGVSTSLSSADYALFTDQYGAATAKLQGFNDLICGGMPVLVSKITAFTAVADGLREQELQYVSIDLNGNTCNADTYVPISNSLNNGVEYDASPGYFALGNQVGYAYLLPATKSAKLNLVIAAKGSTSNFTK